MRYLGQSLSRSCLSESVLTVTDLRCRVTLVQRDVDEYPMHVDALARDLSNGVILCKLVSVLFHTVRLRLAAPSILGGHQVFALSKNIMQIQARCPPAGRCPGIGLSCGTKHLNSSVAHGLIGYRNAHLVKQRTNRAATLKLYKPSDDMCSI